MGEEADADWQAGLIEAGIEDTERWLQEKRDRFGRWLKDPEVKRALHRRPSRVGSVSKSHD